MTFIRLTRPDGRPIWLNASFIVTVEPRRDGGSVVVPVGDGLDYDVREAPEAVLSLLGEVAAPAVVPVPTTDALKTSPEPEPEKKAVEEAPAPEPKVTARKAAAKKRTTRKTATAKPAAATAAEAHAAPAKEAPAPEPAVEEAAAVSELPDEEIERLRKLAPKSVRKLKNTLAAQFDAPDVMATIRSLEMRGVLAVERDHVNWK